MVHLKVLGRDPHTHPHPIPYSLFRVRYRTKRAAPLGRKRWREKYGWTGSRASHSGWGSEDPQRHLRHDGWQRTGVSWALTLHRYQIRDMGSKNNREPSASESESEPGLYQKARLQSTGGLSK